VLYKYNLLLQPRTRKGRRFALLNANHFRLLQQATSVITTVVIKGVKTKLSLLMNRNAKFNMYSRRWIKACCKWKKQVHVCWWVPWQRVIAILIAWTVYSQNFSKALPITMRATKLNLKVWMIHALTYWGTNKNKRAPLHRSGETRQKGGEKYKKWGDETLYTPLYLSPSSQSSTPVVIYKISPNNPINQKEQKKNGPKRSLC